MLLTFSVLEALAAAICCTALFLESWFQLCHNVAGALVLGTYTTFIVTVILICIVCLVDCCQFDNHG